ncbi:MAG: peptidase U34 [Candidatus Schekmanbacteria bacterium]|nr:peptidase U34 [Candidatus Schekmanbacteria bacterium]
MAVQSDRVLFAKNSDRDPNEAQVLEWVGGRRHCRGETLRCTWIGVPQVRSTHSVLLSRPFWTWGAEMGANEHGVVIGNEAVFTNQRYARLGLTGMDLVRLALERGEDAEAAAAVIVDMIDAHGQGGGCGLENGRFTYHNSFIVADCRTAFVLETAGNCWQADRVSGVRCLSNELTLGDFAARYRERPAVKTVIAGARQRRRRTEEQARRATRLQDMMAALRDHGAPGHDGAAPRYTPLFGAMGAPCMHGGGLLVSSQTTASWVSELTRQGCAHWVTATAAPCTSLYKPVAVAHPVDLGAAPRERFDAESYWWRHERLHRRVLGAPRDLRDELAGELQRVQEGWLADPPPAAAAFAEGDRLSERWLRNPRLRLAVDARPWWVRRYWRQRNSWAALSDNGV